LDRVAVARLRAGLADGASLRGARAAAVDVGLAEVLDAVVVRGREACARPARVALQAVAVAVGHAALALAASRRRLRRTSAVHAGLVAVLHAVGRARSLADRVLADAALAVVADRAAFPVVARRSG